MTGAATLPAKRAVERGFTLVEATIVVFIIAILAAVALPSMRDMITAQRVKSAAFDLMADLTYARSEAIARGADVIMRTPGASTNWGTGWIIVEQAGGTTIREGADRSSDVVFTGTASLVTFERTGRATAAGTTTFSITPSNTGAPDYQKRCIRLDPSGRARSSIGVCA